MMESYVASLYQNLHKLLHPVRYNPVSKELDLAKTFYLEVNYFTLEVSGSAYHTNRVFDLKSLQQLRELHRLCDSHDHISRKLETKINSEVISVRRWIHSTPPEHARNWKNWRRNFSNLQGRKVIHWATSDYSAILSFQMVTNL